MTKEKQKQALLKKYNNRNVGGTQQVYVNNSWCDVTDIMTNMIIMNSIISESTYDSSPSYDSGSSSYDSGSSSYDSGGGCDCGGGCD